MIYALSMESKLYTLLFIYGFSLEFGVHALLFSFFLYPREAA